MAPAELDVLEARARNWSGDCTLDSDILYWFIAQARRFAEIKGALQQLDYADSEAELRAGIANLIASLK